MRFRCRFFSNCSNSSLGFITHSPDRCSTGSSRARPSAESCVRHGPGRRVRSVRLRQLRPAAVPWDTRAPCAAVGAGQGRQACGCVVSERIDSPFLLPSGGRCLIENATKVKATSEGENEETDQADYAPRSDGCNQPALSSGGSKREEVDPG